MSVADVLERARAAARPLCTGTVTGAMGLTISVDGVTAAVGDIVEIGSGERGPRDQLLRAEVVALHRDRLTCMPLGEMNGVVIGSRVRPTGRPLQVPVGDALLGRVLDGLGNPMDGRPLPPGLSAVGIDGAAPDAMTRARVDTPMRRGADRRSAAASDPSVEGCEPASKQPPPTSSTLTSDAPYDLAAYQ